MNLKKLILVALSLCFIFTSAFAVEREKQGKARSVEKTTDVGGEVDFYLEYNPLKNLTLFVGEEFYLNGTGNPDAPIVDMSYTSIGLNYKPHPRIALLGAYEFQYLYGGEMRHRLKLMVTPNVEINDYLTLSIRERFQMTCSMQDLSYNWLLRSRLRLDGAIPNTPLYPYAYIEMYSPLQKNPTSYVDTFAYGVGLDWVVDDNNILGIYYEFSHSIDSYYHLLGLAYVLQFQSYEK